MKAIFADSYYYLALLNRDDDDHQRAVELARAMFAPTVTTCWVLTEVGDAMAGKGQRKNFVAFIDRLRTVPTVRIIQPTSKLFDMGLELFAQRPDKDWSLTDCISFVVMQNEELDEALTADHHFVQAGFKMLMK
jgi:hypothetical protein